jgi:hypothetical protein
MTATQVEADESTCQIFELISGSSHLLRIYGFILFFCGNYRGIHCERDELELVISHALLAAP